MLLLYNFIKIKIKKNKLGGVIKHNIQTFLKNHLKSTSFNAL